jgi:NAD(P)-dependent dehydrogenase (short-subunit alcohol dehydrogenase family)
MVQAAVHEFAHLDIVASNVGIIRWEHFLDITPTAMQAIVNVNIRGNENVIWIRAAALRDQVARLLGQPLEQMEHTQWIGHILKRLHLLDESKRKRDTEGMVYAMVKAAFKLCTTLHTTVS